MLHLIYGESGMHYHPKVSRLLWVFALLVTLACGLGLKVVVTPEQAPATLPATSQGTLPAALTPPPSIPPAPPANPTPSEMAQPSLPLVTAPLLQSIEMLDAHHGWGLTADKVVRTTDGGMSWVDVSIPDESEVGYAGHFFLDENTAWISLPAADYATGKVYRTQDGGLSWQQSPVEFPRLQPQFLDAQNGFALADLGAGAGSMAVAVLQTTDGGQTWTEVFNNDPTRAGSSDSLPLGGIKNGMAFVDAQHGWVSGSRPEDGFFWLFATADSGRTWAQQSLALPSGMESAMISVDAPRFFDSQAGVLAATMYAADTGYQVFYFTRDGGANWTAAAPLADGQLYTWASPQDGWAWDGSALHVTHDGAQTWTALPGTFGPGISPALLDFVDAHTGWALASTEATPDYHLFATNDGGLSWAQLELQG